jgi:chemosensory pili system protein ChpC
LNSQELYAVLVALEGDTLVLPNVAIAEVISRERIQPAPQGGPVWLQGFVPFNGRRLHVLSFEALNGSSVPELSRRSRVVVINSLGAHLDAGQFALVAQGYPHLVTLNRTGVRRANLHKTDRSDLVLSRLRIASQEAIIPDLESLELELSRIPVPEIQAAVA